MDGGNQSPDSNQPPPPERDGSFNYDIESVDGGGGGGWRGPAPAPAWNNGSFNDDDGPRDDALLRYDDDGPREPLLRKRTMNTTSQIAIVGANVFPIESLDYE